jgi:DNA-binding MarR family transcriptional regulator
MLIELHMAIVKTYHAQKNCTRPGMRKIGLSPGQPKVLTFVSQHNHCMQREIADALDIEPATVSQILNNMESSGLICRSKQPGKKRAESISITEKGLDYYEKWLHLCGELDKEALKGFSQEETDHFLDYLQRMYLNMTGKLMC